MPLDKGGPGTRPGMKGRREQFADPMNWSPEMRGEQGPPRISKAEEAASRREKDLNAKIAAEASNGWIEVFKPLIGVLFLGIVAFSQFYRRDPANAAVYTGLLMAFATSVYLLCIGDRLPPIINLFSKLIVGITGLAFLVWFIANGSDFFGSNESQPPLFKRPTDAAAEK